MVIMPPRHWKSSLVSEKFSAWYLGRHPTQSVIVASYAASLAVRFSRTVREMIRDNPRYRELFRVALKGGSEGIEDWAIETAAPAGRGAYRTSFRAVGVGGGITGHGADVIIIDDPVENDAQARSEVYRENTWQWYQQTLRTRAEPNAAIILIMTRWHEDDLAGRLLRAEREEGGEHWEVLHLPALSQMTDARQSADGATDKQMTTDLSVYPLQSVDSSVDSSVVEKALWPERFNEKVLADTRAAIGDYAWQCLYQGQPTKEEGKLIKREHLQYIPRLPESAQWMVRYWDMALTEKQTQKDDPDFTATVKASLWNDPSAGSGQAVLYLGEPRLFRKDWPETVTEMLALRLSVDESALRHGTGKALHETAAVQSLVARGVYFESVEEKGDKVSRALPWINQFNIGRVVLVGTEEEWQPFVSWWLKFPQGAHDDAVDAVSGAAQMLGLVFDHTPRVEQPHRTTNPYASVPRR